MNFHSLPISVMEFSGVRNVKLMAYHSFISEIPERSFRLWNSLSSWEMQHSNDNNSTVYHFIMTITSQAATYIANTQHCEWRITLITVIRTTNSFGDIRIPLKIKQVSLTLLRFPALSAGNIWCLGVAELHSLFLPSAARHQQDACLLPKKQDMSWFSL